MGLKKVFFSLVFLPAIATFILSTAHPVYAVTVSILTYPDAIDQNPFTISVSVSGASPATNYLRVDLYKENTTNYFGETFNGADWYSGSSYTQYFPITIDATKKWSGDLEARVASPTQTQYDWQGSYRMRVRRYTSSGGTDATEANNSSVAVAINLPQPSPSPSPDAQNDPTPTPVAVKTKSPSPSPTSLPASPPKASLVLKTSSPNPDSGQILGAKVDEATSSSSSTSQSSPDPSNETAQANIKIAAIFITSGFILLTTSAGLYLWYKRKLRRENNQNGKDNFQQPSSDNY